ncbi:hypothetical protein ISCGN_030004 [Ixodes scapularis]
MTAIHPKCTRGFSGFPMVLRSFGSPCFEPVLLWIAVLQRVTLLAWKRQKHCCNGKRVAQVTDDRNGKIATRGAIVPERANSESDSHVLCLYAGILKPAILTTILSLNFSPATPVLKNAT